MTLMIACNLIHKIKNKSDFLSMPFKELALFADFKRKLIKTHKHIYDYSAKNRVFLRKSLHIYCV